MTPLRIGVVGVGYLGSIHARLWNQVAGVEFAGVYDSDPVRAESVAGEHGVTAFTTLDALLDAVDAVSIASTTVTHRDVALAAIERGRGVFIEKPIAASSGEAEEILGAAERAGVVVQVGHVERFNPAVMALRGRQLHPRFIEAHRLAPFRPRATDVAVVLDLMIHDIDLVLDLVGSYPSDVRANGVSVISSTIDIANARLEFPDGCVANLTASRISQRPMRKMRLFQQDAYISLDFATPEVEMFRIIDEGEDVGETTTLLGAIEQGDRARRIIYERPSVPALNAIATELEEFAAAVRGERAPAVTGRAATDALRVAEEIVEMITKGG